jgi:hypothetical protein
MKCPKQITFTEELDLLLDFSRDLGGDHFSVDEWENKSDQLTELKKTFVNNWCPKEDRVMTEWISIKDRLPEPDKRILVYGAYHAFIGTYLVFPEFSYWTSEQWSDAEYLTIFEPVTHWMPLPTQPEGG